MDIISMDSLKQAFDEKIQISLLYYTSVLTI